MHFLAVRVNVPDPMDGGGEWGFMRLGGREKGWAESREGAGKGGVFDGLVIGDIRRVAWRVRFVCRSAVDDGRGGFRQRCGRAGMADGVLARDDRAVFETGGYMVREVGHNGREDGGPGLINATDDGEEVDCGFEAAGEEAGAGEEKVPDGGGLEVEGRGWGTRALEDLKVQMGQNGADE